MMKILISGKGGSGKSTVSSLLATALADMGYRVLVVDTDESNYGLGASLGLKDPVELMDYIGGKKAVGERMRAAFANGDSEPIKREPIFDRSWRIEDIPAECLSSKGNINMMQIGKVKHFGEGCACPMGSLSREFLDRLRLGPKDISIVDTEAGVEHLGRGVEKGVDLILVVLDPSYESLKLTEKFDSMAREAGKPVYFILNKVDSSASSKMIKRIGRERVIASLPKDVDVEARGLSGLPLGTEMPGFSAVNDFVIRQMAEGTGL
jgi:CO dehydrogenase maturation factor